MQAHAAARQAVSLEARDGDAAASRPTDAALTPRRPLPRCPPHTPLQVYRAAGTTVEDYLPAGSFVRAGCYGGSTPPRAEVLRASRFRW